jgi:glycosyltransferase involved in cell wall biosynthesis
VFAFVGPERVDTVWSVSAALVLIEPRADRVGGHRQRTLVALARTHGNTLLVTPKGATAETAAALAAAGATATTPSGLIPGALVVAAIAANAVARGARRALSLPYAPNRLRRVPGQVELIAFCLTEAACVRTARGAGRSVPVVVLSASEALHAAAAWLGGPHVRFVHEVLATEDLAVRMLGRLAGRRARARVLLLAPTEAVRADLVGRFPDLRCCVRHFSVADAHDRISEAERQAARAAFSISSSERAVSLVGGWWPYKDLDTVDAALLLLTRPLNVLVAGVPVDHETLSRWQSLPHVRLHAFHGPVAEARLRAVYAAADATLVSRRRRVAKESGLVVDALRLGVPLILSDHDPDLSERLSDSGWARLFPTGDQVALAHVLDELTEAPLPRPAPEEAARLGVPTAREQAEYLLSAYRELSESH